MHSDTTPGGMSLRSVVGDGTGFSEIARSVSPASRMSSTVSASPGSPARSTSTS